MKYYIIAGEASGDLHGSNLIKHLRLGDPHSRIRAWGGDLMERAGAEVVKHYRDLAFMGFVEVVANLPAIKANFSFCEKDILTFAPDVLILIDYPGFNLRMARFAKRHGIKVFYYISPQLWAWKKGRVKQVKAYVDEMFVILPFEKSWYQNHNVNAHYVGHPLLDAVADYRLQYSDAGHFRQKFGLDGRPIIALLPGSRKQEISTMLPVMLEAASKYSDYQLVVAGAPSQERDYYRVFLGKHKATLISGATYELLHHSHAALVTSGTATLEAAVFGVPQVVCYKGGWLSYQIARRLVKVKYISLVNLIMDAEVVTELIQSQMNVQSIRAELDKIIADSDHRQKVIQSYQELHEKLGGEGASARTAALMLKTLKASPQP